MFVLIRKGCVAVSLIVALAAFVGMALSYTHSEDHWQEFVPVYRDRPDASWIDAFSLYLTHAMTDHRLDFELDYGVQWVAFAPHERPVSVALRQGVISVMWLATSTGQTVAWSERWHGSAIGLALPLKARPHCWQGVTPEQVALMNKLREFPYVVMPLWPVGVLCSIPPVVSMALVPLRRRFRRRRGICIGCGYNLRGIMEPRCPECGKPR